MFFLSFLYSFVFLTYPKALCLTIKVAKVTIFALPLHYVSFSLLCAYLSIPLLDFSRLLHAVSFQKVLILPLTDLIMPLPLPLDRRVFFFKLLTDLMLTPSEPFPPLQDPLPPPLRRFFTSMRLNVLFL